MTMEVIVTTKKGETLEKTDIKKATPFVMYSKDTNRAETGYINLIGDKCNVTLCMTEFDISMLESAINQLRNAMKWTLR